MDPRALQYYQYLIGKGYSPQSAAAVVGNIGQESSFNPATVGDGGASIGLFQFHQKGEQPAFLKWAQQNSRNPSDPYAQIDFVHSQLQSPQYAKTYQNMLNAPDVASATNAFMTGYERPNARYANLNARVNYANQYLNAPTGDQPNPTTANQQPPVPNPAMNASVTPPPTPPMSNFFARPEVVGNNTFNTPDNNAFANLGTDSDVKMAMGLLSGANKPAPQTQLLPAQVHRPEFRQNMFAGLLSPQMSLFG